MQERKEKAMTFEQFLTALDGNNVLVTVTDISGNDIIKFYAGTTALDDALEARTVRKWSLIGSASVKVILNDAE